MRFVSNSALSKAVKPLIPPVLTEQVRNYSQNNHLKAKRAKFEHFRNGVSEKVKAIRNLEPEKCRDVRFLELEFIPWLGLNDETMEDYPPELHRFYGNGLHIWQ